MKLKIQLQHPNAKAPTYGTDGAGCFDLYAASVDGYDTLGNVVYPGHPVICDTGVAFEVPEGYVLSIRSRSGLAFNHGVFAFPGEVDSDFRGSVQVMLMCPHLDDDAPPVKINPGDRIAQARLVAAPMVTFEVVEQLSLTERGAGGFGSTGSAA
jgi:dUTP pyrophosphatase